MKRPEFVRLDPSLRRPSRFGTRTTRTLALALALAFVVGACDAYAQGGGGGGGSAGGNLTLTVAAPSDGAEVSIPFDVTLESNVALGAPESGNYHVHLFFDTDTGSSDYELVYGSTFQVTRGLAPGEHTIIASLRNADHSDTGQSQTITVVVVVAGAGGGGASPVPAATPAGLGY